MKLVDWRALPAAAMLPAYEAERAAWTTRLQWETAGNWQEIERARAAGRVPGFAAVDDTDLLGWCFYLLNGKTLQIGGLTAPSPPVASLMLERILESPEAAAAEAIMAFVPDHRPDSRLAANLQARGFGVRSYLYLQRSLDPSGHVDDPYWSFHAGRLAAVADLLARAYPGPDNTRPFAPGATPVEWLDYTTQIVTQSGCGILQPWASLVDEDPANSGRLLGAILTTAIAPGIAHVAQVAVDDACRREGRGGGLLRAACGRLARRGFRKVSLLVAGDNANAVRLYERLGFTKGGEFVSAWRLSRGGRPARRVQPGA